MARCRAGDWGQAGAGGVGLAGIGLVVGALLACGPDEGEPEEETCVEEYAVAGDEEYEALDPAAAVERLEGVWASANAGTVGGIPQVFVALVAEEVPDSIGACGGRRYLDVPMEAYLWTSDGSLDTAFGGEVRLEQQGTDAESRMVLTTGINSAIPTSDLSGALLDRVVEGGFPLRLGVVLDYQTGAPTQVGVQAYDETLRYYTDVYRWTGLHRVE